jgi:hypothetical protein
MNKTNALLPVLTLVLTLTACSGDVAESRDVVLAAQPAGESAEGSGTAVGTQQDPEATSSPVSVEYDSDDLDSNTSSPDMSCIELEGDSITFDGSGATVNGNVITITSAGMYSISDTLYDGQIIVDTEDEETVHLVLDGMDVTSSTSAPIYVSNAEKAVITLADGSENFVTDGASYIFEDTESDEPNAAVFSKDDLTINGTGSLTVNANYNNGITSKDDLKITGGTITVSAVNDGIQGRDSIAVMDGTITVNAGGDGMQSDNDEDAEQGYVFIEGGTLNITAGGADGSSIDGRPGQNGFEMSGDYNLYVRGGYVFVDAYGDGIDVNGTIDMTDGVVIVNGPTNDGNGPLDYLGTFSMDGGFLLAVGSSGMAQAPSTSSTQYSVMYNFASPQAAGTMVHIETESGQDVLTFVPTKEYQSVLLSSPELENGSTYSVYSGGSSTGTVTDGLYADGTYTAGTEVSSFTITSIVTGGGTGMGDFRRRRP